MTRAGKGVVTELLCKLLGTLRELLTKTMKYFLEAIWRIDLQIEHIIIVHCRNDLLLNLVRKYCGRCHLAGINNSFLCKYFLLFHGLWNLMYKIRRLLKQSEYASQLLLLKPRHMICC